MSQNNHIELWDKCRQIIRDNISPEQYDAWFKDVTSYQFENDNLTLIVPSGYFVEQLEERFIKILGPAIKRVYGLNVKIYYRFFQVKDEPASAVKVLSTNPSGTILEQKKSSPANPFNHDRPADLDPQLNPRYTFDNYCLGESNKIAYAIGESIAENPKSSTYNPLFVFGPTGVGKTHLIQAIGIRLKEKNPASRVLYITARLFESQYTAAVAKHDTNSFFYFYQSIDTLIVDDIQDLQKKPGTQNTFFHIFNHLHQNNKKIILSSDCAPSAMDGFEDRLLSRFKWGMSVELGLPDLELRRKVLIRKAEQNGLEIPMDVIEYIASTVTQSIRDLEGIVVSLVAHATVLNCEIDLDLAQKVIEHAVKVNRRVLNFELIADHVCEYYGLNQDQLFTKTRKREVSDARQVVMFLAKTMANMSIVAIGNKLDRTHATVNHGCNNIQERLQVDKKLQNDLSQIRSLIEASPL